MCTLINYKYLDLYEIKAQNNHSGFEAKFHEYKQPNKTAAPSEQSSRGRIQPENPQNNSRKDGSLENLDIIRKDGAVTHLRKGELKTDKIENITIITEDKSKLRPL